MTIGTHLHQLALTAAILTFQIASAADFNVYPSGNDGNPGTQAAPFHTLEAARNAAHAFSGKEPVTVHVADGLHYLPQTLGFTLADSGSE